MKSPCSFTLLALVLAGTVAFAAEPANPNTSAPARRILDYFHQLDGRKEGRRILSGQFSDFGNGANLRIMDRIFERTGHWPALIGVDYADFGRGSLTWKVPNQVALDYWRKGGLVTVMAHMYNPANPKGGGLRDKGVKLADLLEPDTDTHTRWMQQLDLMAEGLKELKDAGVVVLWRPFHEMNGGWFWWGAQDPQTFIRVWRHMFDYFSKTKGLDNLLWVYGPNHGQKTAAYYAGDGYVDLVGLDAYTDLVDRQHITGYEELAALPKPFGFTEYGPHGSQNPPGNYDYRRFIEGLIKEFPKTSFFMSWNAKWSLAANEHTKELLDHPAVLNREDLPSGLVASAPATRYTDRFVWVFGWGLGKDTDPAEIGQVLDKAGRHGFNGAVMSFGLDALCKKTPDYFRRLDEVKAACARNKLELIPAVFSVGYGGSALSHDRHLAEGLPVQDAPFLVQGGEARFVPDETVRLANSGFEEFTGQRFKGFNFHDQPGEISFADTAIKHGGNASLRLENFTANPHGHGRVMQEVRLRPHRSYRVSLWARTEALAPASSFQISVLTEKRSLAPRTFSLPPTGDWRKLTFLFNSASFDRVRIYAGMWGGKSGKLWLDDWTIEEVGPLNVLKRPGTPVTVRSEDGATTFVEGRDYAPMADPDYSPYRIDRPAPPLKILPGGGIRDGQRLRVSWYHPMVIHDSQVTVCMAEPALYEIFDHEARLLAERLQPRRVMLNMDEIRMGGTCAACRGRNMAELLGECVTRQAQIVRRHMPGAQVYIWSDMFDPNHNAHGDYYLVEGDYTDSWKKIPKDLVLAVWGGAPRPKSLKFFADEGFQTLAACYYDADDLNEVKGWLDLGRQTKNLRGFMYTPWQKKYDLLPAFGDLVGNPK